jgi:AraC family transcriptional regulator of adaptative response / methylphosphotriester-DNA alkyltransferase methyltransferase
MTGDQKWQAVVKRNSQYDGSLFVAVKSTKIYCRPDLLEYQPIKEIAEKVKLIFDTNFIRQKDMAKKPGQIGLNYHRIVNIFKEYYNVTPKKYYDNQRLEEAKKKLTTANDTIVDIAYSVGFRSLSAFYAFFRKNTNSPPSKYRKEKNNGIHSKN